jgi:HEAT repeat protein
MLGAVLAAGATVLTVVARRQYGRAIRDTLREGVGTLFDQQPQTLGSTVPDQRTVSVATDALSSADPVVRRAAAATMASIRADKAVDAIVRALADTDAEVRKLCVEALAAQDAGQATLEVTRMLDDSDPRVRAAAVRALCEIARYPDGLVRVLRPMVADGSHEVASAAAGCLIGIAGDEASRRYVRGLLSSRNPGKVRAAVDAYASAPEEMPVESVGDLLDHQDPGVRAAAVRAMSLIKPWPDPEKFVALLADPEPSVSVAARAALIGAVDEIEGILLDRLDGPDPPEPRLEEAVLDVLSEAETLVNRHRLLGLARSHVQRLSRMQEELSALSRVPDSGLVADAVRGAATTEAKLALWAHSVAHGVYDRFALAGLSHPEPEQRSYSIEAFESMPDSGTLRPAMALFEHPTSPVHSAEQAAADPRDTVRGIFDSGDAWTRGCVLTELGSLLDDARVEACLSDASLLVRDAAHRLRSGGEAVESGEEVSMVERVIFLRQTPVFSGLAPAMLEVVAAACEEESFGKGDVLDVEGAVADTMFIIVDGSVRILRGPSRRQIAVRGPGEVLGEMSMISRHPRSATMEAAEHLVVLVLSHRAFEHILRQSPEVSLAVMQVLCDRLVEAEDK